MAIELVRPHVEIARPAGAHRLPACDLAVDGADEGMGNGIG